MRRGGIVTARRRRRERGKWIRKGAITAGLILLLCALAMSEPLKARIAELGQSGVAAVGAFGGKEDSAQLTLEERRVYALQLGVFDSGERALSEQQRLNAQGVPCAIWQRDKMRLIASVAKEREALDMNAAGENEAYVVRDTLPKVSLRIRGASSACEEAAAFIRLPDALLDELLSKGSRTLEEIAVQARKSAQRALEAHPENVLYAQLAKSLLSWCDDVQMQADQPSAACYAAVTLCSLCREWRNALLESYSPSTESTASAQRTPSTAAEVMPPA